MINKLARIPTLPYQLPNGALATLTNLDFRRLLLANFLWWGARFMEMIVVGWLVLELTNSAWQVGMVSFFRSIPFLISGFISGPVIDRVGRRKIILAAQTVNLLVYAGLTWLIWGEAIALWHISLGSVILGITWSLDWPARRALLPDLVGRTKTTDALLLENFSQNISRIAGPFLAGLLLARFAGLGAFVALTFLSGLTLWSLLGLSQQPLPRTSRPAPSSPLANILEGLHYVRHNQAILGTLLVTMTMNLLVFPYMVMLPVFARDVLQQGPVGLGVLGAAAGVGAFVGILTINALRRHISQGWLFAAGSAFQTLAILGFAFSTNYSLSLSLLLLSGIGQASFGILQSSIILLSASDEMRGRTMGALVLAIGTGPLGQLQLGTTAEIFGAPWAVRASTFFGVLVIMGIAMAVPGLRQNREVAAPELPPQPIYAGSSGR